MSKKECNRCHRILDESQFYMIFQRHRKKSYRAGHCKECNNVQSREYYHKYKDDISRRKKERYENDPWKARQRALENRCSMGTIHAHELKHLWEKSNGVCEYCGKALGMTFHFDHRLPVTRGGTNEVDNLAVVCASCNSSKQAMTEYEYRMRLNGCPF